MSQISNFSAAQTLSLHYWQKRLKKKNPSVLDWQDPNTKTVENNADFSGATQNVCKFSRQVLILPDTPEIPTHTKR